MSTTLNDQPRPRFRLLVEALPDDVPAVVRLRRALKGLLRGYRLQVRSMTPSELAPLLGKQASATKKLVWTMARDGLLRNDGDGRYGMPEENAE